MSKSTNYHKLLKISENCSKLVEKIEIGDISSHQAMEILQAMLIEPDKELDDLIDSLGYSKLG